MFNRLHPRGRAAAHAAMLTQRSGGFHPTQLPELTAWLSWADATDTGTLSVPDLMGGSPATQSSGALKPAISEVNGMSVGTFSASVLSLPLSAAVNDDIKFGVAFWIKLDNVSGTKTILTVQSTAGGASANKLLLLQIGNVQQVRAMNVDRRAQISPLDTNWRFCYIGIDCGKVGEPAQVLMSLDGVAQSVFFSSDTAWPSSLGTPTGNMLIGAGTAAGGSPLVASVGDIYFLGDQISAGDQGRLMNFKRPF